MPRERFTHNKAEIKVLIIFLNNLILFKTLLWNMGVTSSRHDPC